MHTNSKFSQKMTMSESLPPDHFSLDANRYPHRIVLELPDSVSEWLSVTMARTGRSENELILEILDREIGES